MKSEELRVEDKSCLHCGADSSAHALILEYSTDGYSHVLVRYVDRVTVSVRYVYCIGAGGARGARG